MDAVKIANYGINNWFRLIDYKASDKVNSELKLLERQYSHYIGMTIESKLVLSNRLERTMPGIKKLFVVSF